MLFQFHFVNSVSEKVYIMVLDVNGIKYELNIEHNVELLIVVHNMRFWDRLSALELNSLLADTELMARNLKHGKYG